MTNGVTGAPASSSPVKATGQTVKAASDGTSSFQTMIDMHLDEIARSQVAYEQYKSQGRLDLAQGAHQWAQKQRQYLHQLGVEQSVYKQGVDLSERFINKFPAEVATVYDTQQQGRTIRADYEQWAGKVLKAYQDLVIDPTPAPSAAAVTKPVQAQTTTSAPAPTAPAAPAKTPAAPVDKTAKVIHSAPERVRNYILKAAEEVDVDPHLLAAIAKSESGFRENARSNAGAIGLFQLMPMTAKELGVDPFDTYQNVLGGAKYIKHKIDKYDGDIRLALAAYNAGPGNVDRAIRKAGNVKDWDTVQAFLPKETQNFVPKVLKSYV